MTTTRKAATKSRKTKAKASRAPKAETVAETPQAPLEEAANYLATELTDEQRQAKINAYVTLTSAGLEVPPSLKQEVEAIVAAAKEIEAKQQEAIKAAQDQQQKDIEKGNQSERKWVYNLYNAPFSLRFQGKGDDKGRRIELKARGQRGDLCPLDGDDLKDPNLQVNVELGLIAIIGEGDAHAIISKQTKNMTRTHTPFAVLTNEKGEAYGPDALKVEAEFGSQGVVVGYVDPNLGSQHENAKWGVGQTSGGVLRPEQIKQFVPTGGNPAIISSGFPDKNAQAKIADDIARRKGAEGPSSAGILAVTVDPVQKG
jgi:hypothetical protein